MAPAILSSCVNHPSIEAVGRCKQCGKPFCGSCRVVSPVGNFCSGECKEAYETFILRAKELDKMSKSGGFFRKLILLIKKMAFYGALALVATAIAMYFDVNVPVLSNIIRWIIGLVGY